MDKEKANKIFEIVDDVAGSGSSAALERLGAAKTNEKPDEQYINNLRSDCFRQVHSLIKDLFDDFESAMKDMDTTNGDLIIGNERYYKLKLKWGVDKRMQSETDKMKSELTQGIIQ